MVSPDRLRQSWDDLGEKRETVVDHARPFEPYPKDVLGAVRTFLEPFHGHLWPKVIKIFKDGLLIEVRRAWRGTNLA